MFHSCYWIFLISIHFVLNEGFYTEIDYTSTLVTTVSTIIIKESKRTAHTDFLPFTESSKISISDKIDHQNITQNFILFFFKSNQTKQTFWF